MEQPEFEQVQQLSRRVRVGFADTVGRRPSMEDQIVICGDDLFDLIGVFDGHNGPHVSKFISTKIVEVSKELWVIYQELLTQSVYMDYSEYFVEIFRKINKLIKENEIVGGSTGILLAITESDVFIANAGDCRCVYGKESEFHRVTTDHKPDNELERLRIESCGGEVIVKVNEGHTIARVNGILGVARAFGDFELEEYITCVPDVFKLSRDTIEDKYLVVACDGLWDVVEDSMVIKVVSDWFGEHPNDVEGAAKKLKDLAFSSGSTDNISVVVITN